MRACVQRIERLCEFQTLIEYIKKKYELFNTHLS
jgi:hypothetical protein